MELEFVVLQGERPPRVVIVFVSLASLILNGVMTEGLRDTSTRARVRREMMWRPSGATVFS